jgi:hypothetical protein
MRITYYARISNQSYSMRGKDVYRSINCLRNYISQSNRQGQMQLVFTKTGEDNVNEIFASLRGTTFQNVQSEKDDEYDIDSEPDEEESVMIQS